MINLLIPFFFISNYVYLLVFINKYLFGYTVCMAL